MSFLKRLILGKLSLSLTFWGYGVLADISVFLLVHLILGIHSAFIFDILAIIIILKWILTAMVLSGIAFILIKKEVTILGLLAFIVMLFSFLFSSLYIWTVISLIFKMSSLMSGPVSGIVY